MPKSIIIAGGGLAGLSLALALPSDIPVTIIEQDSKTSNDRTWCFWTTTPEKWSDVMTHSWTEFLIAGTSSQKKLSIKPYTYVMIRSKDWNRQTLQELSSRPNTQFIQEKIISIQTEQQTIITDKNSYPADYIFDSIPPDLGLIPSTRNSLLLQHFTGWWITTPTPIFDSNVATFMDFRTPQKEDTRFFYVLPTNEHTALVEFTVISDHVLKPEEYKITLETYIKDVLKIQEYTITETEYGVIPMTDYPFQSVSESIIPIGTKGGWVKASSGFSFTRVQEKASIIQELFQNNLPLNPKTWRSEFRFRLYDSIILEALKTNQITGELFFTKLFQTLPLPFLLKFLDEKTSIFEELRILVSFPQFLPIFVRKIFHFLVI